MAVDRAASEGEHLEAKPIPERVQALETWAQEHSKQCEDGQAELKRLLGEQKSSIQWVGRSVAALVLSMLAWALLELYHQTRQAAAPAAAPAATQPIVIYAPPGQAPVVVNPVGGQPPSPAPAPAPP